MGLLRPSWEPSKAKPASTFTLGCHQEPQVTPEPQHQGSPQELLLATSLPHPPLSGLSVSFKGSLSAPNQLPHSPCNRQTGSS